MKNGKKWVGIPLIILVFTVVFGVMLTSCDDQIAEDELIAKWYVDQEAANDGTSLPAYEFTSGNKILCYNADKPDNPDTYNYSISGKTFTFDYAGQPKGSCNFELNGTELTISKKAGETTAVIKIGKYYKRGVSYSSVDTPTANPPGGAYSTAQNVSLSTTTSGATIKYTTDNTDPKEGTTYTSGTTIAITTTTTLRAIAIKGSDESDELNVTYIIGTAQNTVTLGTDTEESGTLRYAIAGASDGDTITIQSSVTTITLTKCLYIRKSVTIVGNGVTITRATTGSNQWSGGSGSFFEIIEGKTVTFKGVHFKSARELNSSYGLGGAIYNVGTLTVESCIFNDNQAVWGGAIYSTSKSPATTVKGCTFYQNTATNNGGAMFISGGTLRMTGNLFYGNNVTSNDGWGPILDYANGRAKIYSDGYNVIDKTYGTGAQESGWMDASTDKTFSSLSVSNPFTSTTGASAFAPASGLKSVMPSSSIAGFPTTDFNGASRDWPGAPGAVK